MRALPRFVSKLSPIAVGGAVLFFALIGVPPPAGAEEAVVHGDDCSVCHTEVVDAFRFNPHSSTGPADWKGLEGAVDACTSCHKNAEAHMESLGEGGVILAFKDSDPASTKRASCLECHGKNHPRFLASPHGKGNLDCTSCHSMHGEDGPRPVRSEISAMCQECHGGVATQFEFTEHHRLREGIMTCTSCHNPHEPASRVMLGGFKQNECSSCHTDKSGPFVFEHASSRIEGCVACHEPHGSPNRHQLKFQQVANLCYSCHPRVRSSHANPFFGARPDGQPLFSTDTNCVSCHTAIHGSNLHEAFLR